ncbi:MAG: hypothetical protein ACPL4N_03095 [Candidatus Norongarragalinales archaeon]
MKAGAIAIALFAVSVALGYFIETQNYSSIDKQLSQIEDNAQSAVLLNLFLQTHKTQRTCAALESELTDVENEAYSLYLQLEQNKDVNVLTNYQALRQRYFLTNMRFYLTLLSYKQNCPSSDLQPILFFYSAQNECPECVTQGKVLDALRAKCANYKIYSFPADTDETKMIKTFKKYYGITATPSLVINDEVLAGAQSEATITALAPCKTK